jgi:NAD(P)H-hydrate epimerase
MQLPTIENDLPGLDTEQMIEVDRAMVEDYRIDLVQMMENAGRCLAVLARGRFLENRLEGRQITVMAGSGGNGGGALVAARRLHNWGAEVQVLLAKPASRMTDVPRQQLDILERMGVPCVPEAQMPQTGRVPHLIIDGLIGYSLKGAPYGVTRDLIEWSNASAASVLALDTPSGLDTTTGEAFEPSIIAAATMTLALPKTGLRNPGAKAYVGELYLADISVPPALYNKPPFEFEVGPIFASGDIVRLADHP